MKVTKTSYGLRVDARRYTLEIDKRRLLARLEVKGSRLYYYMSLLSAIDTLGRTDKTHGISSVRSLRSGAGRIVEIRSRSSLWSRKVGRYECGEDTLEYYVAVEGAGRIDRAYFFRGDYRGNELGSVPGFDIVFPACPNALDKNYFHASEYVSINSGHETFAWAYALNSGPLCFAFSNDFEAPWLSVGLAPKEDEYGFQSFEFNHKPKAVQEAHDSILGTQSFSLAYYGHKRVRGRWQTPRLVFHFAREKYAAVRKHVRWLYANEYLTKPRRRIPDWWKEPIFCGWHEQVARGMSNYRGSDLSRRELEAGQLAFAECTQANYTRWLRTLERNGAKPGTVIIDALWQIACDMNVVDERKWPDLRGFIDTCHARDQRVVLWVDLWKRGKVPADECLRLDGKAVCHDPTNPKFIRRLTRQIRTMLSDEPGCHNADGFKIDGSTVQPYGYGMKTRGDLYGFALQKHMHKLFYDTAKAVKGDALICLFTANPYFRDVCDMVRLGDMYTVKGDPADSMRTRARLIQIGMPGVPIDTDGQLRFSMRPDYMRLIEEQARVGIPTLYNAEKMLRRRTFVLPDVSTLSKSDYARIARAFKKRR